MSDEKAKRESDAELEREVRARRKASLADVIGRLGGDLLKGTSPVTSKRQAELEIEHYLEGHLTDNDGALLIVLQRQVRESERLLAASYEGPLTALAQFTEQLLGSQERLRGFVREVDAEWGRIYSERPYFELDGRPAHRDDPYTLASVRDALKALLEGLSSG